MVVSNLAAQVEPFEVPGKGRGTEEQIPLNHAGLSHAARNRPGFSLVELLVTVGIIGLLIALLLPAIQSARESARRVSCGNNLRQIALASLTYENVRSQFPPTWNYPLDQNNRNPAWEWPVAEARSWLYWILPRLEGRVVFDSVLNVIQRTPIPAYYCPSRRAPARYQGDTAKTDYVGCRGTANSQSFPPVVRTEEHDGVLVFRGCRGSSRCADCMRRGITLGRNDIVVRAAMVRDGLSKTIMLGEAGKVGTTPMTFGSDDNEDYANTGSGDLETGRFLGQNAAPLPDSREATSAGSRFGAAHPAFFGVAFADGAVRYVSYNASTTLLGYLAGRDDGRAASVDGL